ncbi:MAG: PEP-CTERM sorting domain-containing protein [Phycisphaerae bacterium]|jgi:hypothetical protein
MKGIITSCAVIAVLLLSVGVKTANGTVFNLANDWSDVQNPNGAWSLNYNDTIISNHFYQAAQGYWGNYTSLDGSFSKAVYNHTSHDWLIGDVAIHALSIGGGYPGSSIFTNVKWTSPSDGIIDISGQAWDALIAYGRDVRWSLKLNNTVLAECSSVYGLFRTNPAAQFNQNLVGDSSLSNISISAGDVVQFTAIAKTNYGHFVGVNMEINLSPVPEPATICLLGLGALSLLRRKS